MCGCAQRRMRQMQTEVQLTFMEAAKGVKKSLRISRGLPSPQTVELNIPAGAQPLPSNNPCQVQQLKQ